ncbi:MAG: S4 domain-containing protein [Gammaproteobacteria bacterium]|jgi:ribosome-associated heat shock protein Hsp15
MTDATRVRLDKWLWAARFFRTRAQAKQAIDGGKVELDGHRCKAAKEIGVGARLQIRQGWDDVTVVVTALSDVRRGAEQARELYEETAESERSRAENAEQRRRLREAGVMAPERPGNKRHRRQRARLKHGGHR